MKKIFFILLFAIGLMLIASPSFNKSFAACVAGSGSTPASCGGSCSGPMCNGSSCATQGYYCSAGNCVCGWAGGSSVDVCQCGGTCGSTTCSGNISAPQCNGATCATQGNYCSAGSCVYGWAGGSATTGCSPACVTPVPTAGSGCTPGNGGTNASCGGVYSAPQCNGSTCATQGYYCSAGNCVYGWAGGQSPVTGCSPACGSSATPTPAPGGTCTCQSGCGTCSSVTISGTSCSAAGYSVSCPACSGGGAFCGDGICNGSDTCSSCPGDCGSCPVTAVCGDGVCNGSETCSSCSGDCGACAVVYRISGTVYVDANRNGIKDAGESVYQGANINLSDGEATTSNASGAYTFSPTSAATYTITLTPPSGYDVTTASPTSVTVTSGSPNATMNFGIAQVYTITGSVYLDDNRDKSLDNGEAKYTSSFVITSSGGIVSYPSSGDYKISNVPSGSLTVQFRSLPTGYVMTIPINGPPASYSVTVGTSCNASPGAPDASCVLNSIQNLNFGITKSAPWIQSGGSGQGAGGGGTAGTGGGNIRSDGGFTNSIPANVANQCGGPNGYSILPSNGGQPGIVYAGSGNTDFGNGSASSTNWVVSQPSGLNYNPPTPNTIRTSYGYVLSNVKQQNLTITDISTVCPDVANCTLPANLAKGVYQANSDLTLTGNYTFPINSNYIFLINGALNLKGKIFVPQSSTALFSASSNITVDKTVGEATYTSSANDLEGVYSADFNFIVNGDKNCAVAPDLRLNIGGNLIANAALLGGSLINNRDLCAGNVCPSISVTSRLDMILNLPAILKAPNYIWKEVAP